MERIRLTRGKGDTINWLTFVLPKGRHVQMTMADAVRLVTFFNVTTEELEGILGDVSCALVEARSESNE